MNSIDSFVSRLMVEGKHANYQLLPPALVNKYPELQHLPYNNIRLDDKRYEYFSRRLDLKGQKITDIGANIGYFAFRLLTEQRARLTIYEPFQAHIELIKEIEALLKIDQSQLNVFNEGVSINTIDQLEKTNIILLFNVLQHAGEDFDSEYVNSPKEWFQYATEYLSRLTSKTDYLVFQLGYSWVGHKDQFCSSNDIISYSLKLLKNAGWNILHCGLVKSFNNPEYRDFDYQKNSKNPVLSPLKKIEYGIKYRLGIQLPNYRFIQRPIFICKK